MNTDISRLKHRKEPPPAADTVPDITSEYARTSEVPLKPLQVRIPVNVFEDFSERAGREFGFSRGSKKKLFLKIWEAYKAQSMQS